MAPTLLNADVMREADSYGEYTMAELPATFQVTAEHLKDMQMTARYSQMTADLKLQLKGHERNMKSYEDVVAELEASFMPEVRHCISGSQILKDSVDLEALILKEKAALESKIREKNNTIAEYDAVLEEAKSRLVARYGNHIGV